MHNKNRQHGMTLVEVLLALGIVAILVFTSATLLSTSMTGTANNLHKQFATQKAISILDELKSLAQSTANNGATLLDAKDDGVINRPVLTAVNSDPTWTRAVATSGDILASGNQKTGSSSWLYESRITVRKLPGQPNDVRVVNVKLYINDVGGQRMIAEVASVIRTIAQIMPPTEVYDVYLLAVENVPGWWVYMNNMVPFVDGVIRDLQARHPGLEFRTHWIKKLSYGRDEQYTPFVNETNDSTSAIDYAYFYPGKLRSTDPVENYYPPSFFSARVNVDGTVRNGYDATDNVRPYALADQYNHAMRFPDEQRVFNTRLAAGQEQADTPTWRMLIEDLYQHPGQYKNAILINLHGELFPFPPIRNYSDAAKRPSDDSTNSVLALPNVRVVTHPEQLKYTNAPDQNQDLTLRVYSYKTVPGGSGCGNERLCEPIAVTLKGINKSAFGSAISTGSIGVQAITGGPTTTPSTYSLINAATTPSGTNMYYAIDTDGEDIILRLFNSPLQANCNNGSCGGGAPGGLKTAAQLYAMDYIPSSMDDVQSSGIDLSSPPVSPANRGFATDLTVSGAGEKNTARWVITIPSSALTSSRNNQQWTIETRIGDTVATPGLKCAGTMYSSDPSYPGCVTTEPPNLSRTYVWRGSNLWLFGDATNDPNLPITESYQIQGDPRHSPYADLMLRHASSSVAAKRKGPLGMGFNRYFDDFDDSSGNKATSTWNGFDYTESSQLYGISNDGTDTNDSWSADKIEVDMNRVYQVLRTAVMKSQTVFTTMTGFSFYYVGLGNEIGYDSANGFAGGGIAVSSKPFGGGGSFDENSITSGIRYVRAAGGGSSYWWGMPWLGDLYPDSVYDSQWAVNGNLDAGTSSNKFYRVYRDGVNGNTNSPAGTTFQRSTRRTNAPGSATFFWIGSATSTFHHEYSDGTTGDLRSPAGTDLAAGYDVPIPTTIDNARPFSLTYNSTGYNPPNFLQDAYGPIFQAGVMGEFYRHSSGKLGSALLYLRNSGNDDISFVIANGLSPTGSSGTAFISRYSFVTLIQSFLLGGLYEKPVGTPAPNRIRQLPRIEIAQPNVDTDLSDPATIDVQWTTQWKRWDLQKYTPGYSGTFAETTPLSYALLYSVDNGASWKHMQDDTVADPGVRPPSGLLTTSGSYTWNTPSTSFPEGNYILRIEAYRDDIPLHYSYHQFRAFIKR